MSLSTLSTIAVQRDQAKPRRSKTKPKSAAEAQETEERGYLNVLAAAIPSEPLALYTFLVGAIVATIDPGESERLGLRWGCTARPCSSSCCGSGSRTTATGQPVRSGDSRGSRPPRQPSRLPRGDSSCRSRRSTRN